MELKKTKNSTKSFYTYVSGIISLLYYEQTTLVKRFYLTFLRYLPTDLHNKQWIHNYNKGQNLTNHYLLYSSFQGLENIKLIARENRVERKFKTLKLSWAINNHLNHLLRLKLLESGTVTFLLHRIINSLQY